MSRVKAGEAFVSITCDNRELKQGLNAARNAVNQFKNVASTLSISVGVLGVTEAIKASADLEQELITLKSVSGATEEQFIRLEKTAKNLGATTSWTAKQVAEGMTALARVGLTADEIDASIESVMNTAKGLGVEVSDAAEMIAASMKQFKVGADYAEHFGDVITQVTNSAAFSGTQFAEVAKYAGVAANAMNQSLEDLAVLSGVIRNSGNSLENTGSSLRNLFVLLSTSPKAASAFEQAFGAPLRNADGTFRSMVQVFKEASVTASTMGSGLSGVLKDIGVNIADINSIASALTATDELEKLEAAMWNADGASSKLAADMDSGLKGSLEKAGSAFAALGDNLSRVVFKDDIAGAVDSMAKAVTVTANWVDKHKEIVRLVGETAVAYRLIQSLSRGIKPISVGSTNGTSLIGPFVGGVNSGHPKVLAEMQRLMPQRTMKSVSGFMASMNGAKMTASQLVSEFNKAEKSIVRSGNAFKDEWRATFKLRDNLVAIGKLTEEQALDVAKAGSYYSRNQNLIAKADALLRSSVNRQRAFNVLLQRAGAFAKAVGKQIAGMFAVGAVLEGLHFMIEAFTASAKRAAEIRRDMEAATAEQSKLAAQAYDATDKNASDVKRFFSDAKNWSSMSQQEQNASDYAMADAVKKGVISQAQADSIKGMRGATMTSSEWNKAEYDVVNNAVSRQAGEANDFAQTAALNFVRDFYNSAMRSTYATYDEAKAAMPEYKNDWYDTTAVKRGASEVVDVFDSLAKELQAIAVDDTLTDTQRAAKIADAKDRASMKLGEASGNIGLISRMTGLGGLKEGIDNAKENLDVFINAVTTTALAAKKVREGYVDPTFSASGKPVDQPEPPTPAQPQAEADAANRDADRQVEYNKNRHSQSEKQQESIRKMYQDEADKLVKDMADTINKGRYKKGGLKTLEAELKRLQSLGADVDLTVIDSFKDDIKQRRADAKQKREQKWRKDYAAAVNEYDLNPNAKTAEAVRDILNAGKKRGYDVSEALSDARRNNKQDVESLGELFKKLQVNVGMQSRVMDSYSGTHTASPQISLQQQSLAKMNQFVAETQQQVNLLQQQIAQQNQIIHILQ